MCSDTANNDLDMASLGILRDSLMWGMLLSASSNEALFQFGRRVSPYNWIGKFSCISLHIKNIVLGQNKQTKYQIRSFL